MQPMEITRRLSNDSVIEFMIKRYKNKLSIDLKNLNKYTWDRFKFYLGNAWLPPKQNFSKNGR